MEAERKIIISIETAFGGSVSVLDHGNEIDFDRSENRKAFGAEELLARISRVLKRNRIRRE
ncbi:MAG TPA: hypothetical protein VK308_07530, partial [Pyrinomonadaceae bacterium]|nr:hypothetical protein [Pyrinomonadaceae bacterium]